MLYFKIRKISGGVGVPWDIFDCMYGPISSEHTGMKVTWIC